MQKVYIIKNLTPWMMDELLAFSQLTTFIAIFLREPKKFYEDSLEQLKLQNIQIFIKPFNYNQFKKKIVFVFPFLFCHFTKFITGYNAVIGWKSIFWFIKLDISLFQPPLNIHAQFATQPAIIALMFKRYFKNNSTYSFTFHAYDIFFKNKWFTEFVNESQTAFSISEFNINYVVDKYNLVNKDKIKLSRLGVFPRKIHNRQRRKKNSELVIGFLSWFVEKKGIKYLLEAINILKEESGIKWKLAGDGPLKSVILDYIETHSLDNCVKYLGKLDYQRKESFFNSIDVFILPSISLGNDMDGIPVVLMEAINYGVPIISTNISGIPEICKDGFNGILIEEKNTDLIVNAILQFLYDDELIRRYSAGARKMIEDYDLTINSKNKTKILEWI